ncbi:MAG: cbb3-type cytochrome c oxidase subunit I [Crocinitomicaceae bacterium]|jgi:cytochrome c oxidase subunit I|nr:cbb3-type cytochrome c oxidase subunit I [Crocinitomicaceae bacterium]MDP4738991.1 cbb3-type cytochrome c oxidase subunit I [Crocinitomicaceae bacterium]MDP4799313.1 cbb3-type cytochrome c oxidase subunit I [Crocinitomicaceae bacterium]MDP4807115.1 cbb3-type cytochrome c oxidase subunit I [Crocinitomicaceae bacterium]MDP4867683.1 cbb3-type cytochrome c oxidase subunit I [Crocinitomicaceae bacterium]
MASHDAHAHGHHEDHHHHEEHFISKYIFSQDHKMIGKQFLMTAVFMGLVAMMLSILFRIQLAWPGESSDFLSFFLGEKWAPNGVLKEDMYLGLVTIHGTIMVFFLLTGGLSGTFSNILIPLQLGARDMASGFLNMLSYWMFAMSSIIMLISLFVESGPAMAGWTVYPPLSALPQAVSGSGLGMTLWLISMTIFIASSLIGSLNYIVTIINLRTQGMTMTRMPLTIWAFFVTAILGVLSFPVLLSAALLLTMDRLMGTSFYLSDIIVGGEMLTNHGGSPILYQHLFWFLGHPEVYIVLLPALGLSSEIIATNSRKPIFGYKAMIGSILAIGFLSFIVWGHHMFVTGMNPFLGSVFVFTTLLIAIPSAVKVFNYLTTLWKGSLVLTPAMLFAIGLVSTFITGGVTGIILADSALDIMLHDTYFVVAHFHIVMGMSAVFGMFAGVYHWFPKMFGRMLNTRLGYAHFWVTLVGAYGVFFPMHFVGLAGAPRRYYDYSAYSEFDNNSFELMVDLNQIITVFAILAALGQAIFLFNFFYSIFRGPKAPQNPWKATTLEWTTPVEAIHGNWPGELPTVHRWPYDYSKPGASQDYITQITPLEEGEEEH